MDKCVCGWRIGEKSNTHFLRVANSDVSQFIS